MCYNGTYLFLMASILQGRICYALSYTSHAVLLNIPRETQEKSFTCVLCRNNICPTVSTKAKRPSIDTRYVCPLTSERNDRRKELITLT